MFYPDRIDDRSCIIGILAAIALPAYQDYVAKSQVTAGLADIRGGVTAFEEKIQSGASAVANVADIGLASKTPRCSTIGVVGTVNSESISCTLDGNPKVKGQKVNLTRNSSGAWNCTVATVDAKYLSVGCK